MHGLIFAGLRDFSFELLPAEDAAPLWVDRAFETTEAYDDEWFTAQLDRIVETSGLPRADVEARFGHFAATTTFVGLYPGYYAASRDTFTFLLGVEERIHELVRTSIPGARPPKLSVRRFEKLGVLISYSSERGLCRLLEGLVAGTADHYGDAVVIEEIQCMHRGDPACIFTVLRGDDGGEATPGRAGRLRTASPGGVPVAGSGRARPRHLGGNP